MSWGSCATDILLPQAARASLIAHRFSSKECNNHLKPKTTLSVCFLQRIENGNSPIFFFFAFLLLSGTLYITVFMI